jgi:hypothetical protein
MRSMFWLFPLVANQAFAQSHHDDFTVIPNVKSQAAIVAPFEEFEEPDNRTGIKLMFALAKVGDYLATVDNGGERFAFYCIVGGEPGHFKDLAGFLYDGKANPPAPLKKIFLPGGKMQGTNFVGPLDRIGPLGREVNAWAKAHHLRERKESPCIFFPASVFPLPEKELSFRVREPIE